MRLDDALRFTLAALAGYRVRSLLMLLAMTIAVMGVLLLSTLGDSARRYVLKEFASLGTHLLIVLPGKSETTGGQPPLLGETPRDLTIRDALALLRSAHIAKVAPIAVGQAPVAWGGKSRDVTLLGTTHSFLEMRGLELMQGQFLPNLDPEQDEAVCVLGQKVHGELFGATAAVGQSVRIHERRFRVIGVLAERGQALGPDIGDLAVIPVASAQSLFNSFSLFRIMVEARSRDAVNAAAKDIATIIAARHEGEEDVTILTQDAMLSTFDRVLFVLTLAVAAISAISMVVAGILIMNVMLIAVAQRTPEIGLLKAIGASSRRIQGLFLLEAVLLSMLGAAIGLAFSFGAKFLLQQVFPDFPLTLPSWAVLSALAIAVVTGVAFGVAPARRAARLDPVQALTGRAR